MASNTYPVSPDPASSGPAASGLAASDPASSGPAASGLAASDTAASDTAASDTAASGLAASGPAAADAAPADAAPPGADTLYQAALTHLARYAATEAGLRRVLRRRVDRWARLQTDPDAAAGAVADAQAAIEAVILRLAQAGAVSDAAFAENRAKSLVRGGRSTRSVQATLIAKGVAPDLARAASVSDAETELAAALVLARKRRIGPYRSVDAAAPGARMPAVRIKELGLLARAGFSRDIAQQALDMAREDAESRIFELRR
jgi:regulatory protein